MDHLIGTEINVAFEPYYFGKARITSIRPAHEYNRPDRLVPNYTTVEVEAIDMTTTSRLMGHSSRKPIPQGEKFSVSVYTGSLSSMIERNSLRYVYGV